MFPAKPHAYGGVAENKMVTKHHKTSNIFEQKQTMLSRKTGTISQRFVLLHFPPVIHLCSQEKCQLSSFRASLA